MSKITARNLFIYFIFGWHQQFFQIMGDLFHRPVIKAELKPKLQRLLDYMHNNLDQTKEIFDEEMAVSLNFDIKIYRE